MEVKSCLTENSRSIKPHRTSNFKTQTHNKPKKHERKDVFAWRESMEHTPNSEYLIMSIFIYLDIYDWWISFLFPVSLDAKGAEESHRSYETFTHHIKRLMKRTNQRWSKTRWSRMKAITSIALETAVWWMTLNEWMNIWWQDLNVWMNGSWEVEYTNRWMEHW